MNTTAIFLIGVGLAMDAFAVSICQGLVQIKHHKREMKKIAFTFGVFQFGMTFVGGMAGKIILPYIGQYKAIIPCIIFWTVAFFMGKEGWENRKDDCETTVSLHGVKTLFFLGIATSIDALFIGISFAMQRNYPLFRASLFIGCITFILSAFGYSFGKFFSTLPRHLVYYLGSVLLFFLGIYSLFG